MPLLEPVTVDGVSVDRHWLRPPKHPRLHLLPARLADRCVVIRRGSSRVFHVMLWHTKLDQIDHGSWFRGLLYPMRCDISGTGEWMVYLALGGKGTTWNGLCKPPWLRAIIHCPNVGTWAGGGVFVEPNTLLANTHWHSKHSLAQCDRVPGLLIERYNSGGEDEPVLHRRFIRDGWHRAGANFGKSVPLRSITNRWFEANVGDDGWSWRPTPAHPTLRTWYRGYFETGRVFEFELDGSQLLNSDVTWATWSASGDLLVARAGSIERYSVADLATGVPSFRLDLTGLTIPDKLPPEVIAPKSGAD